MSEILDDNSPTRRFCIRSVTETNDCRYCRECLSKPCRWIDGGWPSIAAQIAAQARMMNEYFYAADDRERLIDEARD